MKNVLSAGTNLIIYCVIKNFVRFIISVYLSTLTVRVLPAWLISDSLICDCLVFVFLFMSS